MNNLSNEHDDCDPISSPKNEQIEGGYSQKIFRNKKQA